MSKVFGFSICSRHFIVMNMKDLTDEKKREIISENKCIWCIMSFGVSQTFKNNLGLNIHIGKIHDDDIKNHYKNHTG